MRIELAEAVYGPNYAVSFKPEIKRRPEDMEPEAFSETGRPAATRSGQPMQKAQKLQKTAGHKQTGQILSIDLPKLASNLRVSRNKLRILRMLRRHDWIALLHLMPKELLLNALRFFNKEKLLRLIMSLPKVLIIKLLLKVFKLEELIKKMPTSELMRILRSKRLNSRELAKGIVKLDPKYILQLLQKLYGDHDYSHLKPYDLMQIFMQTPKERLLEAFKTLSFKALQPLVTGFVKKDPELLMSISEAFIYKSLSRISKPSLLEGCQVLPPDILIKMLTQLPDAFLMIAAAQVDDTIFEQYLIGKHPDLLISLANAA